jgi:[protein-PII] uridylyltransferase
MTDGATRELAIREAFSRTGDSSRALEDRTALVDGLVIGAYEEFLTPAFPQGLAILAVGGFGRRELFPHSDVDVLLLVEQEPQSAASRDALAAFLRSLWDLGLRLGHSVHTTAECCQVDDRNIELSISLLDQRFMVGDASLNGKLAASLPRFFHGRRQELIRHLCRLTRVRHARYLNTIYHMEPNVKETPGGLRDFQLVRWLSQLRSAQQYEMPIPEPLPELDSAKSFLSALRCYLHYKAGRDSNLLTFDAQEEITEQPFIRHSDPASWMRDYFLHARDIHRAANQWMEISETNGSMLLTQFRDWRSRLSNSEFTVSRERVFFKAPQLLEQDPGLALRLFVFVARHGMRLTADAERRIMDHIATLGRAFADSQSVWPVFKEILSLPHASLALEAMHGTGVLGALLPEWAGIECLVVRDFYHRYTVDEHTLVAIQHLELLPASDDPLRQRFAALLEEAVDRPSLLATLLFHDTGKASRSGKHVGESARLSQAALKRMGAPLETCKLVSFLIDRHLDMSALLSTRDLDEPSTAKSLADRVETVERLKDLTLLTYADISAVNPSAMTPWRLEQLWRLYLNTYNELTRELDTERIEAPAETRPELAGFLAGFPSRYLRVHSEDDIQAHLTLHERAKGKGVAVDVRKTNGTYTLTVAANDRPFLLASIAGVLAGFGMNILKAEAFGNRKGMVLDTFAFEDPNRTLELNPTEVDRLRLTLERVILGKADVKHLLQNRPKTPAPTRRSRIRPAVTFDTEASATATLIEVVAQDRPGLLYDLTHAISSAGCNIEVVLIDTEAHKAVDVFYVTADGQKLSADHQATLGKNLLNACGGGRTTELAS